GRGMAHDAKTPREAAQRAPVERPLAPPPERGSERPLERLPAPKAALARDGLAPPPIPKPASAGFMDASPLPPPRDTAREVLREAAPAGEASRRPARRRPAGPARAQIAANDDVPSIGGLIFALQQKPSGNVFLLATGASAGWFVVGLLVAWALLRQ